MTEPTTDGVSPSPVMRVDFDSRARQSSTVRDAAIVDVADSLRAAIAGGQAAKLVASSAVLFEAGGKHVLSEGAKLAVREVAERGAVRAIAMTTGPLLESATSLGGRTIAALSANSGTALAAKAGVGAGATRAVAQGVSKEALRFAGKHVLRGAGRAASIGFVLDGAVASVEAVIAVRNGSSDKRTAAVYVAKEATTGAIATGAGVLLGAGLVALTGGLATPVVFAVGALGSVGTKRLLRRYVG